LQRVSIAVQMFQDSCQKFYNIQFTILKDECNAQFLIFNTIEIFIVRNRKQFIRQPRPLLTKTFCYKLEAIEIPF